MSKLEPCKMLVPNHQQVKINVVETSCYSFHANSQRKTFLSGGASDENFKKIKENRQGREVSLNFHILSILTLDYF